MVKPGMRNLHNPAPGLVSIFAAYLFFAARARVRLIAAIYHLPVRRPAAKARRRAQVLRVIRPELGALDERSNRASWRAASRRVD
jgi:hypothetical protein